MATPRLILTCEHAGNRVPRGFKRRFQGAADLLASHRGWDPGACALGRSLGRYFQTPLHEVHWTRLLVEANRSPTNPRIWSEFTAHLPPEEREQILQRYWWPHRRDVERAVHEALAKGCRVVHVAVHSFTPVLNGEVRQADIGLLYDPQRHSERELAHRWEAAFRARTSSLRVRRNYPYRGAADGLPLWFRRRIGDEQYAGFELEVNQACLAGPHRRRVAQLVAQSLEGVLG